MKDLNKLSKEIYEANKAKGFHQVKESPEHLFCLVISELMEAVEADRKGRFTDYPDIEGLYLNQNKLTNDEYIVEFNDWIKDRVEDELADAVIRLLDTTGALGVEIKRCTDIEQVIKMNSQAFKNKSFTELIFSICGILYSMKMTIATRIRVTIEAIEAICEVLTIDLWKHVELKLKYNSLRPYKHGKRY